LEVLSGAFCSLEVVHFLPARDSSVEGNFDMKNCLNGLVAFALLALAAPIIQAAEKSGDTKTPRAAKRLAGAGR